MKIRTRYYTVISDRITTEQYFVLRFAIQAKSELMERTLGDESALSEGTVSEILSVMEERIRAADVARANAEALAKQEALMELEREREAKLELEEKVRREAEARQAKVNLRATRIARGILLSISALLTIAVGCLTYVISPIGPLSIDLAGNITGVLRLVGLVIFWLLLLLQTLNLVLGFMPKLLLDRLEPRLAGQIARWLSVE